ncbi:MAG TPA: flagellar motor switch phosphatase FliY, partial [Clostridiales bacterium]|nr:flagellar motor switch phosphatase FliY [Clostridiales bacterium]
MSDILSQEEIDLLLRGEQDNIVNNEKSALSPKETDTIGEIGNISMGTAATTLSTLLGKKVTITAPFVEQTTLAKLAKEYPIPFVAVEVSYEEGLEGKNLLVIRENDVKIITDLMLGGDGKKTEEELSDMHLSAIGEVMNQMVGSAATSLSTLLGRTISISPPKAFVIKFGDEESYQDFTSDDATIVQVKFKMVVEDLIDSYIMQLLPVDFAKDLVSGLLDGEEAEEKNVNTQNKINEDMGTNAEESVQITSEELKKSSQNPDESEQK